MTARKHTIEVDDATAAALESRAAEAGLSVAELLAEKIAHGGRSGRIVAGRNGRTRSAMV
jgi:hypothetical protein